MANELFPNDHVIVSNADIWFNQTLYALKEKHLHHKFLALSRSKKMVDGSIKPRTTHAGGRKGNVSQDTWIFATPFTVDSNLDKVNVGTVHCEEHIVRAARDVAKCRVYNPCLTLQCMHSHRIRIGHPKASAYVQHEPLPHIKIDKVKYQSSENAMLPQPCTLEECES